MKKAAALILAALMLTGCATGPLAKLSKFTTEDLDAALADAKAHGDVVAGNCWSTLLDVMKSLPTAEPQIKGVASAIQVKRDLVNSNASSQLMKTVNLGCAPLWVEENYSILKFAAPIMGIPGLP